MDDTDQSRIEVSAGTDDGKPQAASLRIPALCCALRPAPSDANDIAVYFEERP